MSQKKRISTFWETQNNDITHYFKIVSHFFEILCHDLHIYFVSFSLFYWWKWTSTWSRPSVHRHIFLPAAVSQLSDELRSSRCYSLFSSAEPNLYNLLQTHFLQLLASKRGTFCFCVCNVCSLQQQLGGECLAQRQPVEARPSYTPWLDSCL